MANLLLSVMGPFAQFERELIRERQREGIALAKKAARGRKLALTIDRAAELRLRLSEGENKSSLAREFGVRPDDGLSLCQEYDRRLSMIHPGLAD